MKLGVTGKEIEEAESFFKPIGAKSQVLGKLAAAGNNLKDLDAVIDEMKAIGDMESSIESVLKTRSILLEQQKTEEMIQNAIEKKDYDALLAAFKDADKCGLSTNPLKTDVMKNAEDVLQNLRVIQSSLSNLKAATESREKDKHNSSVGGRQKALELIPIPM